MYIIDKSAEAKLVQMLNEMGGHGTGWIAVQFHLSELMEEYKSDYQFKIAINLVNDLLRSYDGHIYVSSDGQIVVIGYNLDRTLISKLVFQLRYFYMDDPLAYLPDGQENPKFSAIFDLNTDFAPFLDIASRRMAMLSRAKPKPKLEEPGNPVAKLLLSATRLASIERDLSKIDISTALRRQPIYAVSPAMAVRRVFDEMYINIAHLRQTLKADVDLLSNRWLFKYLTQMLDERVISLIRQQQGKYLASPISLNLNVESLLTEWFEAFDAAIKPAIKVSIVIEIPVVDIFADMQAFVVVRDQLQKKGYRLCLDGLSPATFVQIERGKMGFDLVKLQWNADASGDLATEENRKLIAAIKACGANRVILCRCDTKSAIEYGHALGISLFQGRYLDGMVNPDAKQEN